MKLEVGGEGGWCRLWFTLCFDGKQKRALAKLRMRGCLKARALWII